ncbi:MAG TPA: histidine phosphatase family protein [Polyangiaceae bacterium]|nr:histidine phosphatase family protein [Polyangiaceae bacterium]
MALAARLVVLVRHGETPWSLAGKHTGRTDIALTDAGRDAARRVGEALAGRAFARVLSSPLARALDTCRLAGFGDRAERDEALLEWDYGEYEGLTTPEIRAARPDWWLWRDGCPGGEAPGEVAARVDPLVASLAASEGDVLVFAHAHLLRVLAARWLGLPPSEGRLFALGTASLSALGFEREERVIARWNDDSHLRRAPSAT